MLSRPFLANSLRLLTVAALVAGCAAAPAVPPSAPSPPPAPPEPATQARQLGRSELPPLALALPPASRQLQEGYWLGAMFGPEHVATLRAIGVRIVVSAVRPSAEARAALEKAGIAWVAVPMGATFEHGEEILDVVDRYAPEEIFVHCRHGADRTGAIAAFLLTVRHGWAVADALYAVVYASEDDVVGLAGLLRDYGIEDARVPEDPTVGFYSVRAAGGVGGMKARNERYGRLVTTTLDAILARVTPPPSEGSRTAAGDRAQSPNSPR